MDRKAGEIAFRISCGLLSLILVLFVLRLRAGAEIFLRGDANEDRKLDISDPIFTLQYLFQGGVAKPPSCMDSLDTNDDGKTDVSDPIYSLGFLFLGGLSPPAPYPRPGVDPTDDALECLGIADALNLAGLWNGTFEDDEEEYVVVLEIAYDGSGFFVASGMESVGNRITGGEALRLDPPIEMYPFGLVYTTTFDEVTFLFDGSSDGNLLAGEFLTTSGTGGFGSLARVVQAPTIAKAAGTYRATFYGDGGGAMWGGKIAFDSGGLLTAGVFSGTEAFESGSMTLSPAGTGALRDIYEGVLSSGPMGKLHFAGYRAADTGIIAGWYEDPFTGGGRFLFEPIGGMAP